MVFVVAGGGEGDSPKMLVSRLKGVLLEEISLFLFGGIFKENFLKTVHFWLFKEKFVANSKGIDKEMWSLEWDCTLYINYIKSFKACSGYQDHCSFHDPRSRSSYGVKLNRALALLKLNNKHAFLRYVVPVGKRNDILSSLMSLGLIKIKYKFQTTIAV